MLRQTEIDRIAEEILTELQGDGRFESGSLRAKSEAVAREAARQKAKKELEEVAGSMPPGKPDGKDAGDGLISEPPPELDRKAPLLENPQDPDALRRMIGKTTARIGVGRSGPRLKTKTLLTLRADHAAARDAVLMDVSEELIQKLGLFSVATCCTDKNNFLTTIRSILNSIDILSRSMVLFADKCVKGLSANAEKCLHTAERSTSLATMVSALFGYKIGSRVANLAYEHNITCREAAEREHLLSHEAADDLFDLLSLTDVKKTEALFAKYAGIRNV